MSAGARLMLAIACMLCGVTFALIGSISGSQMSAGPWPFYGMAALCVVIAVACLIRSSRPVALRVIGSVIFATYLLYAFDSIGDGNFFRAVAGFVVFGLPAGYLAIWGRYPKWGRWSAAFGSGSESTLPEGEQDRDD